MKMNGDLSVLFQALGAFPDLALGMLSLFNRKKFQPISKARVDNMLVLVTYCTC